MQNSFDYQYNESSRRLIFQNSKNRFNKIILDTSLFETEICLLGKEFNTDKSSYNLVGHRSGFSGFFYILFSQLKDKEINFAEIGIEKNASIKLWRKFFNKAEIHGFEFHKEKIKRAIDDKLKNTFYHSIDVENANNIEESFSKINKKFDIIIDDSTHYFEHQINIIYSVKKFLKENGILIIEDIPKYRHDHDELNYYEKIKDIKDEFKQIFFVETDHINNYTASANNEKLLILIKN